MPDDSDLRRLTDEFLLFLHESAEFQTVDEVRSILASARDIVLRFRNRLALARQRYVVAVVGLGNVGKSTLLNALFGIDLAPKRNGPCTAIPIEFTASNELKITLKYNGVVRRNTIACANHRELREALNTLANDASDKANRELNRVVVELNHPLLANGLTIADTPGFGAAQLGDSVGSHEQSLKQYLRKDVSQVIWVTLAEQGIGKREHEFYDEFFAPLCDDVVVTGCEDWSPQDSARFKRRFAQLFDHRLPTFHFVSGIEKTGIPELEQRIRELADPRGRFLSIRHSLGGLARDLGDWVREYSSTLDRPLEAFWRPDSWFRLMDAPDFDGLKQEFYEVLA